MKPKTLLSTACATLFFFLLSTHSFAQSCCGVPDSLKVISVTDTSFKVSWHKTDSLHCDSIIGATIQWRKAGTTTWTSQAISYGSGTTYTFTDTAGDCTQYQWQVRNTCKHDTVTSYSAWVSGPTIATHCKTTCCHTPDNLKVVSVTDSSFCVSWHITDSLPCDSIGHGSFGYKKLGAGKYNIVAILYRGSRGTINFCDTASPCTTYQWYVGNVCSYKDTSFGSSIATGPNFTTLCDSGRTVKKAPPIQVYPNPAQSSIRLTGTFATDDNSLVTVSDIYGVERLVKKVYGTGKELNTTVDVAALPNGVYFITVSRGGVTSKTTFLKGK